MNGAAYLRFYLPPTVLCQHQLSFSFGSVLYSRNAKIKIMYVVKFLWEKPLQSLHLPSQEELVSLVELTLSACLEFRPLETRLYPHIHCPF